MHVFPSEHPVPSGSPWSSQSACVVQQTFGLCFVQADRSAKHPTAIAIAQRDIM